MDFQYNLTNNPHKVFIYNSPGTTVCQLPKGISMVHILAISAGGGGGGGFTRGSGSAGGGGGGGGTGGVNRVMIPKIFLTDSLIVTVGSGGTGGGAGVAGGNGGETSVAVNDSGTPGNTQTFLTVPLPTRGIVSGGGGGNPGTGAAGGTGGGAGNAADVSPNAKAALGEFVGRAGIAGGDGNATGAPLAGIYGTGAVPLSAGRGGAGINAANPGTSANGGSISGRGFVQDVAGGVAPGGNGQNGMFMMKPFVSLGGTGGRSNSTGNGGNGGNGGPGSGGGGGGAGTLFGVGGTGGRGGDGLVIITCW